MKFVGELLEIKSTLSLLRILTLSSNGTLKLLSQTAIVFSELLKVTFPQNYKITFNKDIDQNNDTAYVNLRPVGRTDVKPDGINFP